jgi:hypothetical protein
MLSFIHEVVEFKLHFNGAFASRNIVAKKRRWNNLNAEAWHY